MLVFFSSCSTVIKYTSDGKIPVYVNGEPFHPVKFKIREKLDFYLFGFYPNIYKVKLDEIASRHGYFSISELEIHEYQNISDTLISVLSLGLYMPRTVLIKGLGKQ